MAKKYDLARKELDGLIVLPSATQASIERGISGQIEGLGRTAKCPSSMTLASYPRMRLSRS